MLLLQRLHQCGVGIIVSILTGHETNNRTALWLVFPQSNELTGKVRRFMVLLDRIPATVPVAILFARGIGKR